MPEGPEVKVMTDNIRIIMGSSPVLHKVTVIKESFLKHTKDLDKLKLPQKVAAIGSKGKFSYIQLEDGTCIGITYGMTGNIRLDNDKHSVVEFACESNTFYYHSTRHFGHVLFMTESELEEKLASLGHDILGPVVLSKEELVKIWRKKNNLNICRLLIEEQSLVCGIGNYIKSEILYHSRVYPLCTVSELSDDALYSLYTEARKIAEAAYIDGGASLYTYTGLTGDKSPFKLKLAVYDRKEDPEGRPIQRMETPDKRSTHWVVELQRLGLSTPIQIKLRPKPLKISD